MWAAFQGGIFILYHFLSNPTQLHKVVVSDFPMWGFGLAAFVISVIVRWIVLPRLQNAQLAFQAFVVGIAFAEATCFIGLFLSPAYKLELFTLSVLGIFQFIPFYARRFSAAGAKSREE